MSTGEVHPVDLSDLQEDFSLNLTDADFDTFVEVERNADDDTVRIGAEGQDVITMNDGLTIAHKKTSLLGGIATKVKNVISCLLYTSPSPRDATLSRMPSSA